jgi:hypothetical protein
MAPVRRTFAGEIGQPYPAAPGECAFDFPESFRLVILIAVTRAGSQARQPRPPTVGRAEAAADMGEQGVTVGAVAVAIRSGETVCGGALTSKCNVISFRVSQPSTDNLGETT